MILPYKDQHRLIDVARGVIPADLALINAQILNVFTGEVLKGTVYVSDNAIAHVDYDIYSPSKMDAISIFDVKGRFLVPGFIDGHMHIESTMLTPRNFARIAIPWGTTTIIHDPHEVANVIGLRGVRYMHDQGADLPMRQLVDIPSCVPSALGLEHAGAQFDATQIHELAQLDRVVGLAEVMDYVAVSQGDLRMLSIVHAAQNHGLYIQGHAPGASGRMLSAYLCGGPKTDHESVSAVEALEKLRAGMYVDARESTVAKNVRSVVLGAINLRWKDSLSLCTDDRDASDILRYGHINDVARQAIRAGMDPLDAIRSITYNPAREAKLENLGAIAPGYLADFVVLDDLASLDPVHVFYEGREVARDHQLLVPITQREDSLETENTVFVRNDLTRNDLLLQTPCTNGVCKANVIRMSQTDHISTYHEIREVQIADGAVVLPEGMLFIAVINRHPGQDQIAVGLIEDVGFSHGALASTVSHDAHNLTVVYDRPEDALLVINALRSCGGGMSVARDGVLLHTMALPVCGLMSQLDARAFVHSAEKLVAAQRVLGMTVDDNPILRIVFLDLVVIPQLRMSDMGLVDVVAKKVLPVFI